MLDRNYICDCTSNSAMKSVKQIIDDLNLGNDIDLIRYDIADLMEFHLQRGKRDNKEVALIYFINALGSLALNANSTRDHNPVGLYTCLIDLSKAIDALDENPKINNMNSQNIDDISYEFLIDALIALRRTPAFHAIKH
jgi:hypothetical protein